MNVRAGRIPGRQTAAAKRSYQSYSFPGPSLGWVADQNLAMGQPGAAYRLDNIFPTPTGGVLRRGCSVRADVVDPVRSIFTYVQGTQKQLFVATDANIWDVTDGGAPDDVYPVTEGHLSIAKYVSTDGLLYLRGVNGEDTPWVYDGTDFLTTPALTMPGGDTTAPEDLDFVWVFKDRFFFKKKESLDTYYLPVGQIGGALTKFSLGGVFREGGQLVFGATWSQETGGGLSSMCVFVTDQGEAAVYQGSNPGDANDWVRVGVYAIGKPLGPNSYVQRGGDLAICTDIGLISLSQALLQNASSLSPTAMSRPIEPEWSRYVQERRSGGWAAIAWTEGQMLAVALPTGSGQTPTWLVSNATTGKWARFTGWNASCVTVFDGDLYFGSADGKVYQANITGADDGAPFTGVYIPCFDPLGIVGRKAVHMARLTTRSRFAVREKLAVHTDYLVRLPSAPSALPIAQADVWGVGVWGEAKWGGAADKNAIQSIWKNMLAEGEAVTVSHQVTSASTAPVDVEFIRTDLLFTVGEPQS